MLSPNYQIFKHTGIILDLPNEQVPPEAWTDGQNVQFKNFASQRADGYSQYAGTLGNNSPIFALMYLSATITYWIYCTPSQVWVTDGELHYNITPVTGLTASEAGDWTGTTLNGVPVLNNGIDPPFYWNGDVNSNCATIPGWPTGLRCNAIRAFKFHLFALGIIDNGVEYPHLVRWSSAADPGALPQSWVPAPDNDAGDVILADTAGKIIDALPLRDVFVVYKEFSTYVLSYVAGQYVFSARKLFLTSGIQSNNCITEINGEHWVLTSNDVIRHDGQNYRSVVSNKVRDKLIEGINPAKLKQCCVTSRHNNQQVWVSIPEGNSDWLTKTYIIDTEVGTIGVRDVPNLSYIARGVVKPNVDISWDSDSKGWDVDSTFWNQQTYSATEDSLLFVSALDSKLYSLASTMTADGQPMYSMLERVGMNIGDFTQRKIITKIIPRLEGGEGETIYIRVGGQSLFNQPVEWTDPIPFVIGTDLAIDVIVDGRLVSVRFEGTTNAVWKLHQYTVQWVDQGLY
jgi:hypothetical protein